MVDVRKNRGSNKAPSTHPLRDIIIELFQGVVQEEEGKDNNTSNVKPSWNSLLLKLKKPLSF